MIKPGEDGDPLDFVIAVQAGEAVSARDALYIDDSDGKAYKCDASDLSKIGLAGFAVDDAALDATVYILTFGIMGGFSGLTVNAIQYLSETAGALTETKPTNFKIAARAMTADTIFITREETVRVRVYESDDTWTMPGGFIKAFVQVQAAGAGSEGGRNHTGNSGRAGGYTEGWIYRSEVSATELITVGVGGAGGIYGGTSAQLGGDSSFGTLLVANGSGSASTPGDFTVDGQPSAVTYEDVGDSNNTIIIFPPPAAGYLSFPVGPVRSSCSDCDKTGPQGRGYGYGGRATGQDSQPDGMDGYQGGPGVVIVTEYY